jgi:hypothetical protein
MVVQEEENVVATDVDGEHKETTLIWVLQLNI